MPPTGSGKSSSARRGGWEHGAPCIHLAQATKPRMKTGAMETLLDARSRRPRPSANATPCAAISLSVRTLCARSVARETSFDARSEHSSREQGRARSFARGCPARRTRTSSRASADGVLRASTSSRCFRVATGVLETHAGGVHEGLGGEWRCAEPEIQAPCRRHLRADLVDSHRPSLVLHRAPTQLVREPQVDARPRVSALATRRK